MGQPYDLVVIGGGAGGLVSGAVAASLGGRVCLISKDPLGGECLYTGCVPSKALIHKAKEHWQFLQTAKQKGFTFPEVDKAALWKDVKAHLDGVRATIQHHDSPETMKSYGIEHIIEGHAARFVDPHTLEVNGERIQGKRFVVATGSQAILPPAKGLDTVAYHTHESIFDIDTLPKHLVVVGGGPIGVELAQSFNRLGGQVTLVQRGQRLLPRESPRASQLILEQLQAEGMQVLLWHQLQQVEKTEAGFKLTLADHAQETLTIEASDLLIAIGKRPYTTGLNLEAAGLQVEPGRPLPVNAYCQTKVPHLYAVGDVSGKPMFTHYAEHLAKKAAVHAILGAPLPINERVLPRCTYTEPEVASVGLLPDEIKALSTQIHRFEVALEEVDRFLCEEETQGFGEVLTDSNGKILSATIVASDAGELIHSIGLLMEKNLPVTELADMITAYPTRSDLLKDLANQYYSQVQLKGPMGKVYKGLRLIRKALS